MMFFFTFKLCAAVEWITGRSICHMGSHSVTCHSTQVNVPHLNFSQADEYAVYLPEKDGRLS